MITKGILKTINYNENSCTVRIPLFETTSSTNEVVLPAIFLTQPGSYNGYSEGDVVFVDFENNSLSNPIIIGKLYLGAIKEKTTPKKGGLTIADLSVTSSATLPLDTKLTFNAADETVASVEGGYNTYKSLLDIIKALYKTETSVSKTTEEALENITKIKVEYLSQLVTDPEPLKEDPNWSISMPNYKDGYNIWQKTTCYNSKGQILSTEIICLSAANAIASYWLRCSTKIHSGAQQAETIEITAMTKLGTSPETADEESSLTYRWSKGANKKAETADPETPYKLIFRNTAEAPLPNENLIITAYRNGAIYESETIFFSPLNTPTLVLTNENASLEYDSYGFTKMPGAAEFVESTAVIKLNNETITAKSYEWTVKNCSFDSKIGTNTATIRITDINESSDSATATCEAIYVDNVGNEVPLTKVFSISKIKQGRSLYKLDLSNEFVTIPAVDDGKGSIKIADDYDWDYLTSHTVNAYYGDEILKVTCSRKTPSSSASEKTFHLKYTVNNVSLKSEINQATESEGVTFVLDNLTGKTGTILYELFRGNKKVASSKFEATRLDSGTPATSYWLNISSPIHTGVRQESDIKIQPKLETGNSGQDNDILAYIRCKYVGETSYIEVSKNVDTGEVTLTAPLKDKNILVEASHTEDFSNIYESETITFSPLNTPVIDLTNDSAALTYTAGGLKINKEEGKEDVVESTATLYLNGKPVEGVTYSWTYTDCIIEGTTNSQTIKIKGLLAPKGTATCSVSYWGETFTKVFSITKQIQGEVSTSYWLKTSCVVHTGTNQEKAIEATAMKKVGENTEEPDTTAKLYYRYYKDENWIGGNAGLKIENYKDEDLYIVASHKENFIPDKTLEQTDSDIYDWETITFSPLNTPVLDLTNDSDSLTYNAENNKIEVPGQTASVTSTAALYLNGDEVRGATYNWTVEGCSTTDYTVSSNNKTITINAIAEDSLSVKATCTATYNGKTYSKVFSVVKQVIATTYWLKVSHPVHVGTNQTEAIRIVAMKKEGTSAETLDTTAYLWYKYKDATTWTKAAEESSAYVLNINSGWEDKDLTIFASHKSYKNKDFTNEEVTEKSTEIYDWEVITFSPLNTPTINLTNDTASLVYNYDDTKYSNDVVSTTAELYLNGTHITDGISYKWTADENKCTFEGSTNSATIQVKEIATGSPTAKVTCKITIGINGLGENGQFAGKSYEKKFTIAKQFKGDPTTSYWIVPSTKIIKINADNTIATDTIEFQIIKKSGTKTPKAITLTSGESLKLKVGINGQTLNDFNGKATDNIYSIDTLGVSTSITIALYDNDTEIDRETISVVKDGIDGAGGDTFEVQQAFLWTSDYTYIPKLPNSSLSSTKTDWSSSKEWAFISTKYITKKQLDKNTPTWKLIFISTRVKTTSAAGKESSYSPWDAPTIYLCKNWDAYSLLTTAEGLFGDGQGIYYTYQKTDKVTAETVEIVKGSNRIYAVGQKIEESQKDIAAWIAENPSERKEAIKVYIDAKYIRTGALKVEKDINNDGKKETIFEAGLDNGNVIIGGFTVNNDKLTSGEGTSTIALQSKSTSTEFKSIYLGNDNPENAPFSVTNTGKIKATSGEIGGFSLSDTSFKTLRTEDNGYGKVDNPDVLITTKGASVWGKVANRDGTDWRLLIGKNFGVSQGGVLYCDTALIKGNIVATSGEIQNMTQITADYVSAKKTLSGDNITANTRIIAPQATIAGFELKAVDTSNTTTQSKKVSLKLNTNTTSHVSNIATYIGGSWLFTLTFACFDGTTQEKFIESRSLSDLVSIQWATFESDTKKTIQVGSSTSTSNILSKVYFNGTILNAYSGSNTITTTVSAGGNGASPSAKWKLSEVYLKVKNSSGGWDNRTITVSGTEIVQITDFKYKANTTNTKLLLNGGIVIAGNLTPNGSVTLGEESTPWTKAFITEIAGASKINSSEVYATTFYASSDKRLKENIKEFIPQKSILELPVVEFDFKNTKSHQIGCIAQDLQEICPELVTTSETGYLAISENKLVYLLLLELKKLHSKVTMLEDELKKGTK